MIKVQKNSKQSSVTSNTKDSSSLLAKIFNSAPQKKSEHHVRPVKYISALTGRCCPPLLPSLHYAVVRTGGLFNLFISGAPKFRPLKHIGRKKKKVPIMVQKSGRCLPRVPLIAGVSFWWLRVLPER